MLLDEKLEKNNDQAGANIVKQVNVHSILAYSYSVYFFAFLIGLFLDFIFPIDLLRQPIWFPVGITLIVIASILILWAQKTSLKLTGDKITHESFCRGPYCFTRSPTHFGLFVLILGFGILINAAFMIFFTIASFIISKFIFLRKEESVLENKYGAPYLEYKKSFKL